MLHDATRALQGPDAPQTLFPGHRRLAIPPGWPPTLLVVVDTEEEFNWHEPPDPESRSVRNIQCLPALQAVFDRHGVIPAYLVDHPVATCPDAVALLRSWAEHARCEIGAHLHPWVNPPAEEPVSPWHAYACNLPPGLEYRKLACLTQTIQDAFGLQPRIFRAGAYGIGPHTPGFLARLGYQVDSSVVPHSSFAATGGRDFSAYGPHPFQMTEGIVELPLTAGFAGSLSHVGPSLDPYLRCPVGTALHVAGIFARLRLLERLRLTPEDHSLADMIRLARAALARGQRLLMLTLHSSSMLPGATDYVRTEHDRTRFLARIDGFLRFFLQAGGHTATVSATAAALQHPAQL